MELARSELSEYSEERLSPVSSLNRKRPPPLVCSRITPTVAMRTPWGPNFEPTTQTTSPSNSERHLRHLLSYEGEPRTKQSLNSIVEMETVARLQNGGNGGKRPRFIALTDASPLVQSPISADDDLPSVYASTHDESEQTRSPWTGSLPRRQIRGGTQEGKSACPLTEQRLRELQGNQRVGEWRERLQLLRLADHYDLDSLYQQWRKETVGESSHLPQARNCQTRAEFETLYLEEIERRQEFARRLQELENMQDYPQSPDPNPNPNPQSPDMEQPCSQPSQQNCHCPHSGFAQVAQNELRSHRSNPYLGSPLSSPLYYNPPSRVTSPSCRESVSPVVGASRRSSFALPESVSPVVGASRRSSFALPESTTPVVGASRRSSFALPESVSPVAGASRRSSFALPESTSPVVGASRRPSFALPEPTSPVVGASRRPSFALPDSSCMDDDERRRLGGSRRPSYVSQSGSIGARGKRRNSRSSRSSNDNSGRRPSFLSQASDDTKLRYIFPRDMPKSSRDRWVENYEKSGKEAESSDQSDEASDDDRSETGQPCSPDNLKEYATGLDGEESLTDLHNRFSRWKNCMKLASTGGTKLEIQTVSRSSKRVDESRQDLVSCQVPQNDDSVKKPCTYLTTPVKCEPVSIHFDSQWGNGYAVSSSPRLYLYQTSNPTVKIDFCPAKICPDAPFPQVLTLGEDTMPPASHFGIDTLQEAFGDSESFFANTMYSGTQSARVANREKPILDHTPGTKGVCEGEIWPLFLSSFPQVNAVFELSTGACSEESQFLEAVPAILPAPAPTFYWTPHDPLPGKNSAYERWIGENAEALSMPQADASDDDVHRHSGNGHRDCSRQDTEFGWKFAADSTVGSTASPCSRPSNSYHIQPTVWSLSSLSRRASTASASSEGPSA